MNHMAKLSKKDGNKQIIGGKAYYGSVPVYADMNTKPGLPSDYVKVKKGIPFVRG